MPIDIEKQRAALEALEMHKFHNGDPDPERDVSFGHFADKDYYHMRANDRRTKKPVAIHDMTHTLFISSRTQ